ncbi:hypothetical protein CJ030_MR6G025249 [Morella rubra]|uniref:Uncharacterized protein n=1 Tax=Morella rubra TaxID=262757 RepID=A0A6A1VFR8_9ROSI|nr:hypothetical protein CJ030_MR6G025249 [Morella rubra]
MLVRAVLMGETLVLMGIIDFEVMSVSSRLGKEVSLCFVAKFCKVRIVQKERGELEEWVTMLINEIQKAGEDIVGVPFKKVKTLLEFPLERLHHRRKYVVSFINSIPKSPERNFLRMELVAIALSASLSRL